MAKINLAPREKRLVSIMFIVMIGMTITPVYKNITATHQLSKNQLNQATSRLKDTQVWREAILNEREGHKAIQAKLKARSKAFNLYSMTNQWIQQTKLANRASVDSKGMNSREAAFESVQITLTHVNMKEILDLLHKMYNSKNLITMQRMPHLRPSRDDKGLDCTIVMTAPKS